MEVCLSITSLMKDRPVSVARSLITSWAAPTSPTMSSRAKLKKKLTLLSEEIAE